MHSPSQCTVHLSGRKNEMRLKKKKKKREVEMENLSRISPEVQRRWDPIFVHGEGRKKNNGDGEEKEKEKEKMKKKEPCKEVRK